MSKQTKDTDRKSTHIPIWLILTSKFCYNAVGSHIGYHRCLCYQWSHTALQVRNCLHSTHHTQVLGCLPPHLWWGLRSAGAAPTSGAFSWAVPPGRRSTSSHGRTVGMGAHRSPGLYLEGESFIYTWVDWTLFMHSWAFCLTNLASAFTIYRFSWYCHVIFIILWTKWSYLTDYSISDDMDILS